MKGNYYEMQKQSFILWLTVTVCQDKMEGFTAASFVQVKMNRIEKKQKKTKAILNPARTPAAPYMPGQRRARMD